MASRTGQEVQVPPTYLQSSGTMVGSHLKDGALALVPILATLSPPWDLEMQGKWTSNFNLGFS